MRYGEFKQKFKELPLILSSDVIKAGKEGQSVLNQLNRWQQKGLILKLKKGVYLLNSDDRKVEVDKNFIANCLYEPSYLSMEYALNYYGLIPEAVADVTSITTRKTACFSNKLGNFIYQHIHPKAFRGFKKTGKGKFTYFLAEPEKAIVDFLYLNLSKFGPDAKDTLKYAYRFQNFEDLSKQKLIELGNLFGSKKLMRVIKQFCKMIEKEGR